MIEEKSEISLGAGNQDALKTQFAAKAGADQQSFQ
jgi:hypothetical protein